MMKKVVIAGLILAGFLLASTFSVTAANQLSYTDDINDVCKMVDEGCDYVSRPNVDIYKLSAVKSGGEVQLNLQLVDGGQIKNSEFFDYTIDLETDSNYYYVDYYDGEISIADQDGNEITVKSYSGVGGNVLQVVFDLSGVDEDLLSLSSTTYEASLSEDNYMDTYPSITILEIDAGGPYTGYVDEPIHFSGSVVGGDLGYEWNWTFDDGSFSEQKNPTHTYSEAGTYEVILYVQSTDETKGGTDNATVTIRAKGDSNGRSNTDSKSSSGLLPFIILVVVIVVAGIAVVVYVMRR